MVDSLEAPKSAFAPSQHVNHAARDHGHDHDQHHNDAGHRTPSPCVTPAPSAAERFVQRYQHAHPLPLGLKSTGRWIYQHPGALRAARAGLATVGSAAYAAGMASLSPLGWLVNSVGLAIGSLRATQSKAGLRAACLLGGVVPVAVSATLGGPVAGLAMGAGGVASAVLLGGHLFEKLLAKVGDDTATYPYPDRAYAGCRLYHVPDAITGKPVPVLELSAKQPFQAGFGHGYLLGTEIHALIQNFRHDLLGMPNYAKQYPRTLAQMALQLNADEKAEISGLVLGFNTWAHEVGVTRRLDFKEVLGLQLLPDGCHFAWARAEARASHRTQRPPTAPRPTPVVGCTSIMLRTADGQVTWGRNMDWGAFGKCGAMSLPIVWKNITEGHDYAVLGVPGIIGAVTGWNTCGLALAMNVVGGNTDRVDGIPASFYNRRILRQAASVADVNRIITDDGAPKPLGPYHMLVADASHGQSVSFFQNVDRSHHVRTLGDAPLWCLNWSYPGHRWDAFKSAKREHDLEAYFAAAQRLGSPSEQDARTLLEGALQLGSTNNFITLHSLVFHGDRVRMRWSNAFAAEQTPVDVGRSDVLPFA